MLPRVGGSLESRPCGRIRHMSAREFGMPEDPRRVAEEEVRPYVGLSPSDRFARFLDLISFIERIWNSLPAERRTQYERANDRLDDPGRWWERVPVR